MIVFAGMFLIVMIPFIFVALKGKGLARKVAILFVALNLFLPLVVIAFKTPLQQGKFFPSLGKILIMFAPPPDVWDYRGLAEISADAGDLQYKIAFTHKYVGNHSVDLVFTRGDADPFSVKGADLKLTASFEQGSNVLWEASSGMVSAYQGTQGRGLSFIRYPVPETLPVNEGLTAYIQVQGDVASLVHAYGPVLLVIRKSSDI